MARITFISDIIGEYTFEYDNSCTIEEVLKDFLSKTNSKIVLDYNKITFLFHNLVLNNSQNLKKTVGEMFRKKIIKINIFEYQPIIGSGSQG